MLIIKSFIVGLVVGLLFTFIDLPLPAPNVLAGVVGIIGIYAGYVVAKFFKH